MKGGSVLVESLIACGIDTAFTVPGESFLAVLEALRLAQGRIRLVTPRHEAGCSFAADAYGKITGRPATVFVSRGPGATNASIGIHTAMQDSTPMVMVVGHVPTRSRGREAFQEVDHHRMFGALAKAVLEPTTPGEIGSIVQHAVTLSTTGRPGPVVVVMPRDISEAEAGEPRLPAPAAVQRAVASADSIAAAARLIDAAERPVVIAGEMVSFEGATAALQRFVEASGAGVWGAYRRHDNFPNDHPAFLGHLEINRAPYEEKHWAEADLIIAAGARLDGITSRDFTLVAPHQKLLHIHADTTVLARWSSTAAIPAAVGPTLEALAAAVAPPSPTRLRWRDGIRAMQVAFGNPETVRVHGTVHLGRVVARLRELVPPDAIVLNDSGTFARWVHRFFRFTRPHTMAGPMAGSMGYAVPGAIGASLACPGRPCIAFAGDGGFQMNGQELVTAAELGLPVKVILCDNAAWGSILVSQRAAYGQDGIYGTLLKGPDFVALARAYGVPAWSVERTEDFEATFREALAAPGPALVRLALDRRDVSPFTDDGKV